MVIAVKRRNCFIVRLIAVMLIQLDVKACNEKAQVGWMCWWCIYDTLNLTVYPMRKTEKFYKLTDGENKI